MSSRSFISSSGTGFDTSSYSLQYVQSRLQRRIGMMCTRIGCFVSISAFAIIHTSCRRVFANRKRFRIRVFADAFPLFLFCAMFRSNFPSAALYLTPTFLLACKGHHLTSPLKHTLCKPARYPRSRHSERSLRSEESLCSWVSAQ